MIQKSKIVLASFLIGILLVFVFFHFKQQKALRIQAPPTRSATIPAPNCEKTEKQVVEKLLRLRAELQKDPESSKKWGVFGMNLHVHGFKQQAVTCYKQASNLDANEFRWPYFCAILVNENGSNESTTWFERAGAIRPDYAPLLVRLGQSLLKQAKVEEAIGKFQKATEVDPGCSHAYLSLAQIALAENRLQESRVYVEKALKSNPRHAEAHSLLATICRLEKHPEKAEIELATASNLPEKTPLVDLVYASLVAEGISSYWYRVRGRIYLENGQYQEATREFESALKAKPDAEAYNNLGAAMEKLGKLEEAIRLYNKSIALHATSLVYYNLGSALGKLGRYPESIDGSMHAIQINPNYPAAYFNIGLAHFRMAQWQQAAEALRQALRLNPDHAPALSLLTQCYLALNDRKSARLEFEKLRALDPELAGKLEAQFRPQ